MHTTVYTLGYTSLKPDNLLTAAEHLDAYLVDTRISPYSRHQQWMGSNLQEVYGERYVHVKELGNINYKDPEMGIRLKDVEAGTWRLAELMKVKPVILFCACKSPYSCHRSVAAQEMADRYNMQVIHLTIEEVRDMGKPATPDQLSLF